jgi:hypothetical protein
MSKVFDNVAGAGLFILFLFINFPGGTIMMALSCNTRRLDGWDWVLSVVIPGFGLFKSLFSSVC